MGDVYFLKGREGGYFDEQKDILLEFLAEKGYTSICFLLDNVNKMADHQVIGEALIRHWDEELFEQFRKVRTIEIDGVTYGYGTVRTLGYDLDNHDVIAHVYAYAKSILKPFEYTLNADHVFLYWVHVQPDLDEWIAVLGGKNIRDGEHIEPVSMDLPQEVIDQLDFIREVNVGDGARHPSDERLIKDVFKTINKSDYNLNRRTLKAYLIREIGFKPGDANRIAQKV